MSRYRRYFSWFFFFTLFINSIVLSQNNVELSLERFKNEKVNKNAQISFKAIDLKTNEVIAELNPDSSIISASTTKLFSTFAALDLLGKMHQNTTRLYIDGPIDGNGILNGNIWIRGGGDVSLGSKYFNEQLNEMKFIDNWVQKIKQKKIRSINGYIISDGSAFGYNGVPTGWGDEDVGNYYGAHAQGINFFDNTILIGFKTFSPGQKTRVNFIWPKIDSLVIDNEVVSAKISNDRAYLFGGPYNYQRSAKGSLPANRDTFIVKGSMPDPELLLSKHFEKKLLELGINVQNGAIGVRNHWFLEKSEYLKMEQIHEEIGANLYDIIELTNQKSINLFAEGVLNSIGFKYCGEGTTEKSLEYLLDYYKHRITTDGLELNDGSGLSRLNKISANHFISLLKYIYQSNNSMDFYNTLPVAGKSGTIKGLCQKGAGNGRIHAKSGTLSNVKSYVGYIQSKSERTIAFSFTINDFSCTNYQIIKYMENVLNALSEF